MRKEGIMHNPEPDLPEGLFEFFSRLMEVLPETFHGMTPGHGKTDSKKK